jgi:Mg-chelatase subunit ChlD
MKQALEDVELTGKWGSLKVMIKIKPMLDEWWGKLGFTHENNRGNDMDSYVGDHKDDMEEEVNQDNVGNSIMKEKGKGIKQMEEVNDKINETVFEKEDVSYVEYIKGEADKVMYNEVIANNMRKLFRRLTMVKKNVINDRGNEVDIESYITNKIEKKNLNDCLIDRRIAQGVCVLISIDVSSSMSYYEKVDIARKLVGTLFKSVEGLKNVEVKAQTWSSGLEGKLRIQEINNYNETKYITASKHGETPTHLAIKYASMTAKKMKGHKKLIIILTDGHPQYHKNKHKFYLGQLIKMSQKAMIKALRQNPNIMCVHLGRSGSIGMMTQIFGAKRFIHTGSMNEASETVIKKFRELIMRTMLR